MVQMGPSKNVTISQKRDMYQDFIATLSTMTEKKKKATGVFINKGQLHLIKLLG